MRRKALFLFVVAGLVIGGCSSSEESASAKKKEGPVFALPDRVKEANQEKALKHFIDGALYDSKGEYPRAIQEYQNALRYDRNPAIYYALSKDYSILGKHALAAQAAKEAITLDSVNISYRENLAAIYLNAFQQDLAVREYENILAIDSNATTAWYSLARLFQSNRPLKAIEIYERLLDRQGDSWELLLQVAELYSSLGRFDEAAERYRRLLDLDPSNRLLRRQLAETYGRAGKSDEAVAILKSLLELDDTDPEVVAILADVYLDKQEYDKAVALYEKLLETEAENPQIQMRVGIAYFGQIQSDSTFLPKARATFERASRLLSNDWRPFWYLGAIADMEGNDTLALRYFESVTGMQGGTIEAWWFVGTHYFDRNEHGKVVETMEKARKLFPQDFRVYLLLGLSYSRLGQNEPAVENLRHSLQLNPNDVNTLSSLALTLDGMKRYEESDSLYEKALEIDPTSHLVLNNYGYSLAERGIQLDRALKMATEAVNADTGNSSYLDTLGWIYYKLGNYDEARYYIQKAVDQGDASAVVHEHLGDIHFRLGNKDQALNAWKKAFELDGNNADLGEKLKRGSL